jgi:hypothetical protein
MIDFRDWLSYDPATGIFRWLKTSGKGYAGAVAGTPHPKGYLQIAVRGERVLAHRLAWWFCYGEWPETQIDHKNADKTDNRIDNLREATNTQNHANRGAQRNSTSGIKGVYWWKPGQKWRAQISVANRSRISAKSSAEGSLTAALARAHCSSHFILMPL